MSDTGHYLTWINASQPPLPLISMVFRPTGSAKADVMAMLHQTANHSVPRIERDPRARKFRRFGGRDQLRQALARAEALLREKDLQIQAVLVWRESAANHLAGLTRRQRQIMDLVLAGQPSKNIAAYLGISQRTVENHRAAIMKRTGSTCLPALARMALAAAWDDATAPPTPTGWHNAGGPDFAPIGQAPADRLRGSAAGLSPESGCAEPVVAERQWSCCYCGFAHVKRQAWRIRHKLSDTSSVPEQMSEIAVMLQLLLIVVLVLCTPVILWRLRRLCAAPFRLRGRRHRPHHPDYLVVMLLR